MNHEVYETLAAGYAVDALDGEDLVTFESHLAAGCARCETVLRESAETLFRLTAERPRAIPPPGVKRALLERLEATAPRRSTVPRSRWLGWAVGTAAAALVAAAMTGGFVAGRYEAKLGQMAREMTALRGRVSRDEAALREELAAYRSVVDLLRDPATRVVALHALGPTPHATARVIWNEATGGHVVVANLPPPPPGKTYELWTIARGTPRAAGFFATDASGSASRPIAPPPERGPVDVFAVTIEPEGGVAAPTGPTVLTSAK